MGRRVLIIVEAAAATAACQLVELPTNSPLVILSRNTIILICVSSCCNVQFADMETFALLLCDRFWKLNLSHRYFVFLSKCKIVESKKKNVSYGTYGKKSIEISPVSCNSNLKTKLPNKNKKEYIFLYFSCTWFNPNHGISRFQKLSLRKRQKTISEGESCPNMCRF